MQRALDVSNYTGGFGPDVVACWREWGYGHLVCGTQRPEITRRQLEVAVQGGMTVDAYVYLYWRYDVGEQVRAALETVAGYPVGRLWLDCEDATGSRTPEEMVALIGEAVAACACGIYTGRWWWVPSTGNSSAFSHLPLWHAEYTSGPQVEPDFDGFRAYGGWKRPFMWQFQGTTYLCGAGVDLNLRHVQPAPAPPVEAQESREMPSREELERLRAGMQFLKAFTEGRYVFLPVADGEGIELRRVEDGRAVAFEPAVVLAVE
jgi:hypothetical protein